MTNVGMWSNCIEHIVSCPHSMHDGMIKISTSITSMVEEGEKKIKASSQHREECHENEPENLIRPCAIQIDEDCCDVVIFL